MDRHVDVELASPLTNEHVRRALDSLLEGCQVIGPDFRYRYLNPAAAAHGRRPLEALMGHTMEDAYPGISQTAMFGQLRRCMTERVYVSMENEFQFPDGSAAWFELRMEPVPDGVFVLSIDITERRKAALALEALATRYGNLLEASFDAISVSQDGVIREANPGFVRLFGYDSSDEVIGRPVTDFVAPEFKDETRRRIREEVFGTYHLIGERRDGRKIHLEATSRTDTIDGQPARITAVRDVTQQRIFERQVRQTQKMEAVGRLAGGVAHDFNNLLTVIIGHIELVQQEPTAATTKESLAEARGAAQTAAGLTRQLLAFSRQQVTEARVVEIDDVARSTEKLLRRLIGEDVALTTKLETPGVVINVDPQQLQQVLINLAINARDAMPKGGNLSIETSVADLTGDTGWDLPSGRYVMLAVSDTGVGMDATTQERVFEPFFTTKEATRGTGLGLSIAYGVVKQAGGTINVYSEPGIGTVFRVYLPVAPAAKKPDQAGASIRPALAGGTETILVVEDSPQVRDIARRVLSRHGYKVVAAESPTDALRLLNDRGMRIDMLLTDLVMPEMNGRELAGRFLALHPAARVMFMSGYTDDTALRNGAGQAGTPYLQKPFTPDGLAAKVRQVLDGAQ